MLWVFPEYGGQVALRLGDFKLVRQQLHSPQPGPWEIYHLADDPAESRDLAATRPDLIQQAEVILQQEVRDNPVFPVKLLNTAAATPAPAATAAVQPPSAHSQTNVLFIAIDDQNDWIGHLGGHPLAHTPHLDRLAQRGTTFLNAHSHVLAEHRRWLPRLDAPPAPGSAHRVLTYDPATDLATWEGRLIRRSDPIPE